MGESGRKRNEREGRKEVIREECAREGEWRNGMNVCESVRGYREEEEEKKKRNFDEWMN